MVTTTISQEVWGEFNITEGKQSLNPDNTLFQSTVDISEEDFAEVIGCWIEDIQSTIYRIMCDYSISAS